jgi:signal transduction histidine kinase
MTQLKLFLLLFFLFLALPLSFVVWKTYTSLLAEEQGQMQFFADTIFTEMETELARFLQREENRAIDEYSYLMTTTTGQNVSPLATAPSEEFIVGYMQNNPDNSLQTPYVEDTSNIPEKYQQVYSRLLMANTLFIEKKISESLLSPRPVPKSRVKVQQPRQPTFADRFVTQRTEDKKLYLGKKEQRKEKISASQIYNVAPENKKVADAIIARQQHDSIAETEEAPSSLAGSAASSTLRESSYRYDREEAGSMQQDRSADDIELNSIESTGTSAFEVEVAPFQSVSIDPETVFVFRRILISNQIYRQGFLVDIRLLFAHLTQRHFNNQPLAQFTLLTLHRNDMGEHVINLSTGTPSRGERFFEDHQFPAPFDFITASLLADNLPHTAGRTPLLLSSLLLLCTLIGGTFAIYSTVRTIVAMAEKKSQFVSTVTHELKTPLTNIRMYVEMLQQGIAVTPEQEQQYLAILGNESNRLTQLITNVLDLAQLEKKQRSFHFQEGTFDDVFKEVYAISSHQLKNDGFTLHIENQLRKPCLYDQQVMIQILLNLIENSCKFGKDSQHKNITLSAQQEHNTIHIDVTDSGPGIPPHALPHIFDDFYRADNELTRKTGGTGIGLSLVKKFIIALGGTVSASNNKHGGCTISIRLPTSPDNS